MKKLTKISLKDKLKKLDNLSNSNLGELYGGTNIGSPGISSNPTIPVTYTVNLPPIKTTPNYKINPAGGSCVVKF